MIRVFISSVQREFAEERQQALVQKTSSVSVRTMDSKDSYSVKTLTSKSLYGESK